jgi:hypothetical protein
MEKIDNPLEPVAEIFNFKIEEQNFLPLFHNGEKTGHNLSIVPEYKKIQRDGKLIEFMEFNCAIQRDEENHAFVQFNDEVEFYQFMGSYNPKKEY